MVYYIWKSDFTGLSDSRAISPMVRLLDPGLSRTFGPGSTWAITFHASGV